MPSTCHFNPSATTRAVARATLLAKALVTFNGCVICVTFIIGKDTVSGVTLGDCIYYLSVIVCIVFILALQGNINMSVLKCMSIVSAD